MLGTWAGFYKYDNKIIQKAMGFDQTYFTLTITEFDGKNFKGIVNDDVKSGGMEETGEIFGEIKNENISFRKLMPKRSLLYSDGRRKSKNISHPILHYSGILSKDKTQIAGDWKFKISIGLFWGFIPLPYRPGKGTWNMKLQ